MPGRARLNTPRLGVRPGRPVPGRTPFVILVVALLSTGLLGLLMLNTWLHEGSLQLGRLQKQTTTLTDQQQTLQQQIAQNSAPDALEKRARDLGMVPGGDPAFLGEDGKMHGTPGPAQDSPPVHRSGTDLWQQTKAPQPAPAPSGDGVQINVAPPAPSPSGGPSR